MAGLGKKYYIREYKKMEYIVGCIAARMRMRDCTYRDLLIAIDDVCNKAGLIAESAPCEVEK